MTSAPLLVSGSAARRLAVYKGHTEQRDQPVILAAALLPRFQLRADTDVLLSPRDEAWRREHDPALEVAVTPRTLLQLKQYHGSLIKVSSTAQRPGACHLARLFAVSEAAFEDSVAYLSPLLAFNLGLQLYLEPLLRGQPPQEQSATEIAHLQSHCTASTSVDISKPTQTEQLAGTAARVQITSAEKAASADSTPRMTLLSQAGCQAAAVRVADSMKVASVRVPQVTVFGAQADTPAAKQPSMQSSAQPLLGWDGSRPYQVDHRGSEESTQEASEELATALKRYLEGTKRLFVAGDVFAVPIAGLDPLTGRTQFTKTLFSASGATQEPELHFCNVVEMQPEWPTAMVVDPLLTAVTLEGSCATAVPPGVPQFLRQDAPKEAAASWQPPLDVAGPMMPLWRSLAALLAPLLHRAGQKVRLRTAVLVQGPSGAGKRTAASAAASALGVHLVPFSCQELRGPSDSKTAAALTAAFEAAGHYAPAVLLLRDLPSLVDSSIPAGAGDNGAMRLAAALSDSLACPAAEGAGPVLLVATAASASDVPPALRRCFTHELTADAPELSQRAMLLRGMLPQAASLRADAVESTALQTAGLLPADLSALVADAAARAVARAVDTDSLQSTSHAAANPDPALQNGAAPNGGTAGKLSLPLGPAAADSEATLEDADLELALEAIRQRTATAIGAPQVPDVKWEDVGGLEHVKEAILETVELPLRHPELFASGLRRRSGLLLYGPPGTGKTLVAKAVATECSINFLSVKGPELINMYIGESERQVREVFERARRARPCVLFFDELDSLAPARGAGADSGGVMDRVVSQLLAEVDGLQGGGGALASSAATASQDVFLIGATNRPDLLDGALMRPGRLDKLLYVGIAQRPQDKLKVLQALTRKFKLAPDVALGEIAAACAPTLTGADLYALCADAWMAGLHRVTAAEEDIEGIDDIVVEQQDFYKALASLTPSLSQDELARYQALRERYQQ